MTMLRQRLSEDLKTALKARAMERVAALRLILAALKDRDIAARPAGNATGIGDAEIVDMLQKMVRQRQESIALYRQGQREELAAKEESEIGVIRDYLPQALSAAETEAAILAAIAETGAAGVKDMGKVMALLKSRFAGRLDFATIGPLVKTKLG